MAAGMETPVKRYRIASFAAASCLVASVMPHSVASATEPDPTPDEIVSIVTSAAESAGVLPVSGDSAVTLDPPEDASHGVGVSSENLASLTVPLPHGVSLNQAETTEAGATVYRGDEGVDVTVEEVPQGVRVSTVLWDRSQDEVSYNLPEGLEATPLEDGSLQLTRTEVVTAEGVTAEVTATVGSIEPAWAVDANGTKVGTSYEVEGGVVTQTIDARGAAFPVVADPTWSFTSPVQVRIRFNRAETATIAQGGWGATGLTAVCATAGAAVAGPAGAAAFGAGCLLATGPMVYTAGVAQNSSPKRCLEQFMTFVPLSGVILGVPWYGTYACR